MKDRAKRRHNRDRAIRKAFRALWGNWFYPQEMDESYLPSVVARYPDYPKDFEYVEDKNRKYELEDEYRESALKYARKRADNMRNCSCAMCKHYNAEKPVVVARREAELVADFCDFCDVLEGGEILPPREEESQ
jgi:hypothetical protein